MLQYRDEEAAGTGKAAGAGVHLARASISGATMRLAVNSADVVSVQNGSALTPGDFDMFSDRPGISKTLGKARIAEIWIWPDRDVLAEGAMRQSLFDHWQRVTRDGV